MNGLIRRRGLDATKLLLSAVFIVCILLPFVRMMMKIEDGDFSRVVGAVNFLPAVKNSLLTAFISTTLSVSLGLALAFCLQRSRVRFKSIWAVLLIAPMLIPSISHGMGLIVLFGNNGIITNLFGLENTIYGFTGIVVGSVLYSYPVAFLMFNDVLKYQDSCPYEAAAVLGISPVRRFWALTMPYLLKPLVSAVFAVFTMVITDYGIPLMIGGKTNTLAKLMYQEVLGQSDFGKGSAIALFLLIPAVITFVFNTLSKNRGRTQFVTKPFDIKKNIPRDIVSYTVCALVLGFIALLLGAFCALSFTKQYPQDMSFTWDHVKKMLDLGGDRYLQNSIIIALIVSVIGIITAFFTAYMTARVPSRMSSFLHLCSITSLAVPGVVLGLSYSITFSGGFLYGTLAIIIMANLMHFFASPYLMMYNSLGKMNINLENVGATLGINRMRIILRVIIPQSKSTLLEMFSYFFVNSMMTISAVSFLANARTKPLSLLINQFEAQMLIECAAIVSLVILLVNVFVKVTVYLINRFVFNKKPAKPNNPNE